MKTLENSAVLIINMQIGNKELCSNEFESLVPALKNLLVVCKKNNIPIAICEFLSGGKTSIEVTEGALCNHLIKVFTYKEHDVLCSKDLGLWLKRKKVKTLILSGMFAKTNVQDIAVEAIKRGYKIVTSKDLMANHSLYYGEEESKNDFSWYSQNGLHFQSINELTENVIFLPKKNKFYCFLDRLKFIFEQNL